MLLNSLSGLLSAILIWVSSLFPEYHLDETGFVLQTMGQVWQQAYTWSGVIPVDHILRVLQIGFLLFMAYTTYNTVMTVINLVRGSGA